MKVLLLAFPLLLYYQIPKPTLAELRLSYQQAGNRKAAAEKLDQLTAGIDTGQSPILIGYKGANEMFQAKYASNLIAKLNRFNKGKSLLQMAIIHDTTNLETRFLRFSIQYNVPSFLNYKEELTADKRFLIANTSHSKDQELKQMIINYFETTGALNYTELNQLKK
jgi:hypothetical protein